MIDPLLNLEDGGAALQRDILNLLATYLITTVIIAIFLATEGPKQKDDEAPPLNKKQ